MCGQVIYHLLDAAHAARAPWPVVVLVSCMPVVTLGFGAALTHLLRATAAETAPGVHPVTAPRVHPHGAPGVHLNGASAPAPVTASKRTRKPVTEADAEVHFAADLAAGQTPSARRIRRELKVGQPRAAEIRQHLETVITAST